MPWRGTVVGLYLPVSATEAAVDDKIYLNKKLSLLKLLFTLRGDIVKKTKEINMERFNTTQSTLKYEKCLKLNTFSRKPVGLK